MEKFIHHIKVIQKKRRKITKKKYHKKTTLEIYKQLILHYKKKDC